MAKKQVILIAVALLMVALAAGAYFYWKPKKEAPVAPAAPAALESALRAGEVVASSAAQGVLPSIGGAVNPLQNQPNVNPVDVTNPFRSVKTNPFK